MPKTLLFDLDETLLGNKMDSFLPAYLQALAEYLAPYIAPDKMIAALTAGTRQMIANLQPDCMLREAFDATFFPAIGLDRSQIQPVLDRFYVEEFPSLQRHTHTIPLAQETVSTSLQKGYQVVIATSPLFPRSAIEQRLSWAGMPLSQYPFSLVSSYEDFHFAKPNPAYFAEVLARLGWPEGDVLMVGDDLEQDIIPASRLGIATYWINSEDTQDDPGEAVEFTRGSLGELTHGSKAILQMVSRPPTRRRRRCYRYCAPLPPCWIPGAGISRLESGGGAANRILGLPLKSFAIYAIPITKSTCPAWRKSC